MEVTINDRFNLGDDLSFGNADPVCDLFRHEHASVVSRFFIGLTLLGGGVPSSLHSSAGRRLLLLSLTCVSGGRAFVQASSSTGFSLRLMVQGVRF